MKCGSRFRLLMIAAVAFRTSPLLAQGILVDPGFESGTFVLGGVGGWDAGWGSPALVETNSRSGNWSMQANYGLGRDSALIYQWATVEPGVQYALTGWGLTPIKLETTTAFLFLRFSDINHASLGLGRRSGEIDSLSPVNTWIPMSVTATAPAGAAYAQIMAGGGLTLNFAPWMNAVYFDDLNFTSIPEPQSLTLITIGLSLSLLSRNGRWCSPKNR